jgi:hypothetical protein
MRTSGRPDEVTIGALNKALLDQPETRRQGLRELHRTHTNFLETDGWCRAEKIEQFRGGPGA